MLLFSILLLLLIIGAVIVARIFWAKAKWPRKTKIKVAGLILLAPFGLILLLFLEDKRESRQQAERWRAEKTAQQEEQRMTAAAETERRSRMPSFTLKCSGDYHSKLGTGREEFSVSVSPKDNAIYLFSHRFDGDPRGHESYFNEIVQIRTITDKEIISGNAGDGRIIPMTIDRFTGEYDLIFSRGRCQMSDTYQEIPIPRQKF